MKQIAQNYKKGSLTLEDVPAPALKPGGVLVRTRHSLISAGTEKMKVDDSKRSYLGMARARPEKVKQVIDTFKQLGPMATYRKVMNRLDSWTPLGYSLAGEVIEVGEGVTEFAVGDLVACGGGELATHAEVNWIPVNLCCRIPKVAEGVAADANGYLPTEQAAFATVGAIAMQGVRQAEVQVGESVAVIGLGLVGLIAGAILKAAGCRVIGLDIDPRKAELARAMGLDVAAAIGEIDVEQFVSSFTGGMGADAVLITTGTKSNAPIVTAGEIARDRATIVDIGINKMDVPWQLYYAKELVLKQSRSYGPGRYDDDYEMKGRDYPVGYVRWTEKRNMDSVLQLMASGRMDLASLITHRFKFDEAPEAYAILTGENTGFYVGVVLEYDAPAGEGVPSRKIVMREGEGRAKMGLAFIGAGNFARTMLLPNLKLPGVELVAVASATGLSGKDTAAKFGFRYCTTDYAELLGDDAVDTVMIATRHDLHGKLVCDAIEAGKHVYTEKPLCLNEDELDRIRDAYGRAVDGGSKQILTVGFNRRYAPLVCKTKAFYAGRTEPMIMHYRCNAGFMEKNNWYQDRAVGGGRIIGEVCHFIDTLQYLTGALPVSVYAQSIKTDNQATTLQDNVIITLQFDDGSVGSITYLGNGDPRFPKEYIEVFCENRVAVMDNFSTLTTMAKGKRDVTKARSQDKGQRAEMAALRDAVVEGQGNPIPFESVAATTLATFRILASLEQGAPVAL